MRTCCNKALLQALALKRDENGSLTIFSLFIFLLILLMAGMSVDLMRYELNRSALQNSMDSGVVAASSLNQGVDPVFLVKDYVAKAGFDPDRVTVTPTISQTGGTVNSRSVSAYANFELDTYFMKMMGIKELPGHAASTALEGSQILEIVLVLDISGSMGWGTKMAELKVAAKEFVTTVLDNSDPERVTISIVPYNQQVYMDTGLMARLNLANSTETVLNPPAHVGAISSYQTMNSASRCARFQSADFDTRRLADAAEIDVSASFSDRNNNSYNPMGENAYWCGNDFPKVLLYQNNETILHDHIDSLPTQGMTAIDYGMNWAVGILDPSFEPVVADMIEDGDAPAEAQGHPVNYGTADVLKYIVLMTDGKNTLQQDLTPEMKSGPSRVWYSETLASGNEFGGYLFEMPENSAIQRWYIPGSPNTSDDDLYLPEVALPPDAQQWTTHQLFRRFSIKNVANYFYNQSEGDFANEYVIDGGYSAADTNLKAICDKAKENSWIEVFTVAFEAPDEGQAVLEDCASGDGNYFDVDGTEISAAFSAIAVQISLLRLTE